MPSLQEVHARLRAKKREKSEIQKAFKDELVNNPRYQQVAEQLKTLKEERKSIENQAWAAASTDADKLDLLGLDIKSDKELLSDIALNMYTKGETVEVIDEYDTRWVPSFTVNFKKDDERQEEPSSKKPADLSAEPSAQVEALEPDFAA
ncbi:MAG: hypothetical protein AAB554_02700 [Patescibacteria group bacterium]